MKKSINVKMTFAAGEAKVDLKTTIMKNGNVVNPATLSQDMLNFCATIAANKARALKRTVVGFTGSEITVELPEGVDLEKLEDIVNEEVNDQLDSVDVDIELEAQEEDYIQEFTATTTVEEIIDPLAAVNEEEVAAATTDTETVDPLENETLEIAAVAAEAAADPIVAEPTEEELAGLAAQNNPPVIEVFSARNATAKFTPKAGAQAVTTKKSMFASGDQTQQFKATFMGNMKRNA